MFSGLPWENKFNIQKVCAKFTTVYLILNTDNTTQKTPPPMSPHTLKVHSKVRRRFEPSLPTNLLLKRQLSLVFQKDI